MGSAREQNQREREARATRVEHGEAFHDLIKRLGRDPNANPRRAP